jgi:dienelactone hydrolase
LKKAIARAQRLPHAIPDKAAVIGFSLGGGALYNATPLPNSGHADTCFEVFHIEKRKPLIYPPYSHPIINPYYYYTFG